MTGATALAMALVLVQATAPVPVRVYLGPIPSVEGFVSAPRRLEDSYRDVRAALKKKPEYSAIIRLVDDVAQAQVIVEVADRRLVDTGLRTSSATMTTPGTAVGNSVPLRTKQMWVHLAVPGTDYRLEIDGAAGLRWRTYRNQAENALRQVVEWVSANRARLIRQ